MHLDPVPDISPEQWQAAGFAAQATAGLAAAPAALADTFLLHSYPSSTKTIYLDFDGHTTSGTYWNTSYNWGWDIVTPAFSLDSVSAFSDAELERIQAIWQRVAEDYRPFGVDVTTQDPGVEALRKAGTNDTAWGIRVVIGGRATDWFADQDYGGVAYTDSFIWNTDTPAFVFEESLSNGLEKFVAEAATHEAGHTLGLDHDGTTTGSEYYSGHGSGATGWAPIMGSGYNRELTQWSKGEYPNANNSEDDLAIITAGNGFGYRPDDHGNTSTAATALGAGSGTTLAGGGIIERSTDIDYFSFVAGAGTVDVTIEPFERGPNLDILATLYDHAGSVIATSNPATLLNASFQLAVAGGTYYLAIEGTGKEPLTTGYSDYGSLGSYSITGTIPAVEVPLGVATVSPPSGTVIHSRQVFVDVEFSKAAVGVDVTDMVLGGAAAAAAYVSPPSDLGGNVWRFPVRGLTDGTLQIQLAPDADDIEDSAGNDLEPSPTVFTYSVAIRDVLYQADMTADPGWNISPESGASGWQWGTPAGGGGSPGYPDPSSGYTGASVMGYNLAGNYANGLSSPQWAQSPPIDASAFQNVQLSFYRWLNVESYVSDQAVLQVSNDGTAWTTLWQNPSSQAVTDASWKLQTFDISSVADGHAPVYVRWGLGPTNSRNSYSGWNIDDVVVSGVRTSPPGATISPTSGLQTDEAGGTASFSVVLDTTPLADVTIALSSSREEEGTVSPASVTFTPGNWATPQTVTVTGVGDAVADGDVGFTIITGSAVSADAGYDAWNPPDVSVTNRDDDLPVVLTGDHVLLPNTPNQVIPILVAGDYAVQGLNLHVQIADGGPEAGGTSDGPAIQAVDLVGNADMPTVFTGNNGGQTAGTVLPQVQAWEIMTVAGTVSAGGLLATLTIDTTGFWKDPAGSSSWPVLLADTTSGSTGFVSFAGNPLRAIAAAGSLTLNTPPVALDSSITIAEDTAYAFGARDFGFSDADPGDGLSTVRITSLPLAGTLTFEGATVVPDQAILAADLAAGKLAFLPAADANGAAYATFLFRVDDGLERSVSAAAMTIHVTPINDSPTAHDQSLSVVEDGSTAVTLTGFDPDDDTLDYAVIEPPAHGVLSGAAPNLRYTPDADFRGPDSFAFVTYDGVADSEPATVTIAVLPVPDVVGRYVFYNNSARDGNDPAVNPDDDTAIAADKQALRPGQQAEFVHYTSYDKGLNGLLIDLDDLPADTVLTAADFRFRAGNSGDLAAWPLAPQPDTVTMRPGAGVGGSTRVTLIWSEQPAVRNQWLEVTVLATPNTNLPEADTFYFGNAIGESGLGNSVGSPPQPLAYFPVNVTDEIGARNHAQSDLDPVGLDNAFDFNRDGVVDEADELIARTQGTGFRTALRRLRLSTANPAEPLPDVSEGGPAPEIVVGTHTLEPNTPGQTISLYVTGGWPVQGLNFNLQIADGGPAAGGVISGPAITAVDLLTGTIFAADNTGMRLDAPDPAGDDPVPQHTYRGTSTAAGTVAADGLLAMVTIDTTGFERGAWSLTISDTVNGATDFAGVEATILDGAIILRGTWTNPVLALDVDGNGRVTPLDALTIINYLNANPSAATLPLMPELPPPYYDANRDNACTPADVLAVINYLNAREPTAAAEGESPAALPAGDEPTVAASPTAVDSPRISGAIAAWIPANGWRQPVGVMSRQAVLPVSVDFPAGNSKRISPSHTEFDCESALDDLLSEILNPALPGSTLYSHDVRTRYHPGSRSDASPSACLEPQ